jgi:hypothetical protein
MDTAGVATTVYLQNENGTVLTVAHTGTSNNRIKNYAIPADTRAKMWRLVIVEGVGGKSQLFSWNFERWHVFEMAGPVDPPEIVLATPWTDCSYPFPKLARQLILSINTNGVPCAVSLETDSVGVVQVFSITTTYASRSAIVSCNVNLSGVLWRLLLTPGVGGEAQLWSWSLDTIKLPPAMTQWSSYGQAFGYKGWHFYKQFWFDYACASPVNVTFTSDTGSITQQFPAHATRAVERFLFPTVWGSGLNKSKLLSVYIETTNFSNPFSMYADMSGIEWFACGSDRHMAYQQTKLSEFEQLAI